MLSPCNKVCTIDEASGWCRGCGRTLAEIAAWGSLGDPAQRRIAERLPQRLARLRTD
ncbi:MAG: DUF1289 domain-containing protein [Sphingomonadaceae bacterium]|nr:DUF1289 domain-containing protein [Sphingomonadaceae bacterium]